MVFDVSQEPYFDPFDIRRIRVTFRSFYYLFLDNTKNETYYMSNKNVSTENTLLGLLCWSSTYPGEETSEM